MSLKASTIVFNNHIFACLAFRTKYLLCFLFPFLQVSAQSPYTGIWEGALSVQGIELDMRFNISESGDDDLVCTMDVPMQGAEAIPADQVVVKEEEISIGYKMLGANFTGRLIENNNSITGVWTQNGMTLDLMLSRVEKKSNNLVRPQEPSAPFPYDITELHFHNEAANNIELSGTLTIPKGEGPFPAVVLISGSGPQNRDEELMGHKPFWILADHFSRNGIAVFRYDDRGVAYSQGDFASATSADFATDAAAAVSFLKQHPKINKAQIGLCGHSEGGMIAPIAAAGSEEYAFLVLMAGPGQPIVELLLLQSELISRAMGESEADIHKGNRINKKIYDIVTQDDTEELRKTKLKEMLLFEYNNMSEEEQSAKGSFEEMHGQIEAQMFNPWMEYFLRYEPATYLRQVSCPVLAINGENDLQVAPKENLQAIRTALEEGACKTITIKELKGLNHLFQHSQTGSPAEYGTISETFAPEALDLITDWIRTMVGLSSQ